jgi:hypothetical protein
MDAAEGDVQKASNYLVNQFGIPAIDAKNVDLSSSKELAISAARINVAEKRLANPAFRQPLKTHSTKLNLGHLVRKQESDVAITIREKIKDESPTAQSSIAIGIKAELVEDALPDMLFSARTPPTHSNSARQDISKNFTGDDGHSRNTAGNGPRLAPDMLDKVNDTLRVQKLSETVHCDDKPPIIPQPSLSSDEQIDALDTLMSIFPAADQDECEEVLRRCDGDPTRAYEMMEARRFGDLISGDILGTLATANSGQEIFRSPIPSSEGVESSTSREETLRIARGQKKRASPELDSKVRFLLHIITELIRSLDAHIQETTNQRTGSEIRDCKGLGLVRSSYFFLANELLTDMTVNSIPPTRPASQSSSSAKQHPTAAGFPLRL